MVSPELERSWKRTESYIREAMAHLSPIVKAELIDALANVEHFLKHNELGFAFQTLAYVVLKSQEESLQVFKLLALAAANMDMFGTKRRLDMRITKLCGSKYKTCLPNENA